MEDRTLLSTLTVMNNKDSGSGSFRAAIAAATSGETINFCSLTLTQDMLTNNVAAATPGNDAFGGALSNLGKATIANCAFTGNQAIGATGVRTDGAVPEGLGGALCFFAGATVNISNCGFTGNLAQGGMGVAGSGGAIVNFWGDRGDPHQ